MAKQITEGRLVRVLDEWCEPFDGCYMYYLSRRQPSPAAALLAALRFRGRTGRSESGDRTGWERQLPLRKRARADGRLSALMPHLRDLDFAFEVDEFEKPQNKATGLAAGPAACAGLSCFGRSEDAAAGTWPGRAI